MNYYNIQVITFLLVFISLHGCQSVQKEEKAGGGLLMDVDGHAYRTVKIGTQVWMAENLETTVFAEGTPIPLVENYEQWASLEIPAYCWYNNDSLSSGSYGALYNGYAMETGDLCPEGWHVPADEDWIVLERYLGGASITGGALKEEGMDHWKTPNTAASNESGFTALPGGYRSYTGTFNLKRTFAYWWSNTEKSWYGASPRVIFRGLQYEDAALFRDIAEKNNGFSVRCVKDQQVSDLSGHGT